MNAALAALLLASTPATAQMPNTPAAAPAAAQQTTVSQTVTFSASNLNYWPGAAGSLQPVQLFPTQPDGSHTVTFTPPLPFSEIDLNLPQPPDSVDFSGSVKNLNVGLTLNAYATPGGVDISYPGTLALKLDPQITPNTAFNFSTSFTRDQNNSSLNITPPNFDATLGGKLAANFEFDGIVRTPGHLPNLPFNILSKNVNTTFDIFDVQRDLVAPLEAYGGLGSSHDLHDYVKEIPAGVLSFEIDDPRIFSFNNASVAGSPTLSYNGYQTMLDLNGDISNLVGYLGYAYFTGGKSLDHGLFNATYDYGGDYYGFGGDVSLSYQIADLYGEVPFGFEQNFTFQATPKTTLTLLGPTGKQIGQPMTVTAGSNSSIQVSDFYTDGTPVLPYGVTSVPITIQSSLDFTSNTLHNDTNFQCKPGLYFQPYYFYGSADLTLADKKVFSVSDSFGYGNAITLASNTFSVNAFSSDKTIDSSNYSVSPAMVTSTINFVGTSIDQPHPALSGMSQTGAVTGTAAFPLTLTGTGFTKKSQAAVTVSGVTGSVQQTLNAKYLSPTSLQVTLPVSDLKTPATLSLSVFNPGLPTPATYNSNAVPFLVALPGCYLNAAAALQTVHLAAPSSLSVTLSNNSTVDAADVRLTSVVLDGVKPTVGTITGLGTIKSGSAAKPVFYSFPASALPAAGPARLVLGGTLSGKPFTLTVPVAVPTPNLVPAATLTVQGLPGIGPAHVTLALKNESLADTDAVVINTLRLNGASPTRGSVLPLTVGTLNGGVTAAAGSYVFPANALSLGETYAQLVVTGTQHGKPFSGSLAVRVPAAF